jgi:cytidine deaminase
VHILQRTWTLYEITEQDRELIQSALHTLEKNFDDFIYHHTVGAGIRCKNGRVYTAVNCAGVHGVCAEYAVMSAAIASGEREFEVIAAVHEKAKNGVIPPCGNCRQMLFEYCPDILVIVNDEEGNLIKVRARELLPFAWEPIIC